VRTLTTWVQTCQHLVPADFKQRWHTKIQTMAIDTQNTPNYEWFW